MTAFDPIPDPPGTQEEWDDLAQSFEILHADIVLYPPGSWGGSRPEGYSITTISLIMNGVVLHSIRQDVNITGMIDGAPFGSWMPDVFHWTGDGSRLDDFEVSDVDCETVEQATYNPAGAQYGRWQHISLPFETVRGPETPSTSGQCSATEWDPPDNGGGGDPGGGGGDPPECDYYLVTIYEWDGSTWVIVDQFVIADCD